MSEQQGNNPVNVLMETKQKQQEEVKVEVPQQQEPQEQPKEQEQTQQTEKDDIEALLQRIEHGEKPWYFSAKEIYKLVKIGATKIPQGQVVFDNTLNGIDRMTKSLKENTKLDITFDTMDTQELINNLDKVLSEQTTRADDGLDHLRSRFTKSLRELMSVIVQRKNWVEEFAEKNQSEVTTRFENYMNLMNSIIAEVKNKYSDLYSTTTKTLESTKEKVQAGIDNAKAKIQEGKEQVMSIDLTLYGNAMKLLNLAQPYVQDAYVKSTPFVNQAIVISQPYVAQALPFVNPVVEKVTELNKVALENKTVGPYVSNVYAKVETMLTETKNYVTPSN